MTLLALRCKWVNVNTGTNTIHLNFVFTIPDFMFFMNLSIFCTVMAKCP
jgi:hypothetical protein